MEIKDVIGYARNQAEVFPELKDEIYELLRLCIDEIADGASPNNEMELCLSDIDDLVENFRNERKS